MKTLVFFLEEPSAEEMLKGVLPRLLPPDITPQFITFQGKSDLESNLERRLRGWLLPDSLFVVMRDQDSGDCRQVKEKLAHICRNTGKNGVLVRVACRELESFYLGDLAAVGNGLEMPAVAKLQGKAKYRRPDILIKPSLELEKITKNKYQKLLGSRAIAPHLSLADNRSHSFNVLIRGILDLVGVPAEADGGQV